VAAWLVFLMVPAISAFITTHSWSSSLQAFNINARIHGISAAIYFLNSFLLIPFGYYRNRRWLFWLGNALILAYQVFIFFFLFDQETFLSRVPDAHYRQYALSSYYASSLVAVFMSALLAGIALLAHHVYRSQSIKRQLKEEQQKRTEAELEWLKNQLNPHFLFNTLNNISSLVQIDADKAQDAIAQLSDLLRYAMYETRRETVPLQGEVEFMRNYIALMKLRCSEKTVVNCQFSIANSPLTIAPLLFISLIENAFKHGVSSNRDSRIDITLTADEHQLTFTCENTSFPKSDTDRSGSGIGLENTRRRLDLIYQNRYTWEQTLEDNIYKVKITIEL
jgi:LytS/YehU family sensor histidine kinase